MGFEKGGDILFLNVSCGYLVNKEKEIKEKAFTGRLLKVKKVEDDFEGKQMDKVRLTMSDGKITVSIKFTLESWYSVGFFQRIGNVKTEHEFTLGVMPSEQNEKMSFCWMKQGDLKIEKKEIPMPEKVKVGKTEVTNYEKFVEYAINWIENFKPQHELGADGEPLPF